MGTCSCFKIKITFEIGSHSPVPRNNEISVTEIEAIQQINNHLIGNEIEKIRKLLPSEYRKSRQSEIESHLTTLKKIESFIRQTNAEKMSSFFPSAHHSVNNSELPSPQISTTKSLCASPNRERGNTSSRLFFHYPRPEIFKVECKSFTAVSSAPFLISPSTPKTLKKYHSSFTPGLQSTPKKW
ncbi:Oidioi.mRNA.OKI2018_I69.PAR.g10182.t1.cds [Oikopleura dioica]|uniref:Oidioi.mRNA.OKI2018_I69.PAR.g10182.t1.cds n=1 Tax=Oikopleura dioica TaxID=34765 RepID=A0ABN7RV36_OIKDI|nr:Oidioi.mRNA.OKI2018_I69.PAR.g10182.t1.cds [Oikopleura dioica]